MNAITSPKHYTSLPAACSGCAKPIECIDVIKHMNFNRGNAVKYIWRAGLKGDDIEDLQKAIQCLEFEISRVGGKAPAKKPAPVEPHDPSRRVDTSRINFALNNPDVPVPDTVKDGPVEAVEPDDDPEPVEELWRPVEGKYGRTRDGRKVGPMTWISSISQFAGKIDDALHFWRDPSEAKGFPPRPLDLISEWVEPEATLTMREGGSYVAKDGEIWTDAKWRGDEKISIWDLKGSDGKASPFYDDGSFFWSGGSDHDLVREVPAPDAPLDAQAIYDNNPADLVGSVWSHNLFLIQHSIVDFEFNYRNTSIPIVRYSDGVEKNGVWWSSFVSDHTLLRLASKEAAE